MLLGSGMSASTGRAAVALGLAEQLDVVDRRAVRCATPGTDVVCATWPLASARSTIQLGEHAAAFATHGEDRDLDRLRAHGCCLMPHRSVERRRRRCSAGAHGGAARRCAPTALRRRPHGLKSFVCSLRPPLPRSPRPLAMESSHGHHAARYEAAMRARNKPARRAMQGRPLRLGEQLVAGTHGGLIARGVVAVRRFHREDEAIEEAAAAARKRKKRVRPCDLGPSIAVQSARSADRSTMSSCRTPPAAPLHAPMRHEATPMSAQPIKIAILAMGGEGGGVLADWIVDLGEANGYLAQTTSVPGVAQRTGATIYYVELYPARAGRARRRPAGAGADAAAGRRRRGARLRADGSAAARSSAASSRRTARR